MDKGGQMDFSVFNKEKLKVWLEILLAVVLVAVVGIAGNHGAFDRKIANADTVKAAGNDVLEKAEAENQAAQSGSGSNKAEKGQDTSSKKEDSGQKDASKKEEKDTAATGQSEGDTAEEVIAEGQYPIMGKSSVTVDQMVEYFKTSGEKYPSAALSKGGADSIETFCQMYYDEAVAEGVRPEVAFVQTMKETGWLQYGGDASIDQFNFAGLGTTGGGVAGNSYPDVRTGIRAQIQHLKAYATEDSLKQACVDERYEYVTKGCAPYVEWLGQQENPKGYGWATADNYGYSIVDMISNLKKMK